jgi:hypothetical protein
MSSRRCPFSTLPPLAETPTHDNPLMASSKATKVAPFANGLLISVGASPPVNPFKPWARQTLRAQSIMPVYCRLDVSSESVCSLDLMTSTG